MTTFLEFKKQKQSPFLAFKQGRKTETQPLSPLGIVPSFSIAQSTPQLPTSQPFFAPSSEGVRIRDVLREIPGSLGRLGQEILKESAILTQLDRTKEVVPETKIQKL